MDSEIKSSTDPRVPALVTGRKTKDLRMRAPRRDAESRRASLRSTDAPAKPARPWSLVVMAGLAVLLVGYAFIPADNNLSWAAYSGIGVACMVMAFWGYVRGGRQHRAAGWLVVLLGFLGWVVGDVVYALEATVLHVEAYPAVSDVIYIVSYGVLAVGLSIIVRRRGARADLPAVLDAAILAAGVTVVAGVFVIAPLAGDSSLTLLGKLTSTAYPIADVLLLGILARLWTTPGARTTAFRLLTAAFAITLVGDAMDNVATLTGSDGIPTLLRDYTWLSSYVLIAGAAWSPSIRSLTEPLPGREELADPTKRLAVLTGGLLLPAVTLMIDDLDGGGISGILIATGSVVMSVLVLARMAGLLSVVRAQAVQLGALARSDSLTGVANRRTLDHELSRACQAAREFDSPLSLAILDLDHFKRYNDTFGHLAGDRLLREATAAWADVLSDDEVLARYGGEEFVVIFPGQTAAQAQERVLALLRATPDDQTFSAGVANWDPRTEPSALLSAADVALYYAKTHGRNRVCLAVADGQRARLATPDIVVQPIIELATGATVAVEALSRFTDGEPLAVFEAARLEGTWAELEAAAIEAARKVHRPGQLLSVNVSLDGLTTAPVQEALDGDLTGVILEITERTDATHPATAAVQAFRDRGAIIAIDDWGRGYSNLDRILMLRPQMVKIDMSLVHQLDLDYNRAAIQTLCAWADLVGAQVCAEGVETEEQWRQLKTLGVHLGQGWYFGAPSAPGRTTDAPQVGDLIA